MTYLTVDDVAAMLCVHKNWVYERVRSDEIPHLRIGSLIRFKLEDLEDWLQTFKHNV